MEDATTLPFSGTTGFWRTRVDLSRKCIKTSPFGNWTPSSSLSPPVTTSTRRSPTQWHRVVLHPLLTGGPRHPRPSTMLISSLILHFFLLLSYFSLDLIKEDERGCAESFNFYFFLHFFVCINFLLFKIWLNKWPWTGL